MKFFYLFAAILFTQTSLAQAQTTRTTSLIHWLIEVDNIKILEPKSDISVFYNQDAMNSPIMDERNQIITDTSLKEYLTAKEIKVVKTAPHLLMQIDWRIKYSMLPVTFFGDKTRGNDKENLNAHGFSPPIFLNKDNSRVIIGEYFKRGITYRRKYLLLCEFKAGKWRLIVRSIIFK